MFPPPRLAVRGLPPASVMPRLKTEVIRRQGPIGDIPPAEFEVLYYAQVKVA